VGAIDPTTSPWPPADTRDKPVRQFARGFVEAHRQRIFLGLSVAGTLLLGPFSVNNFIQGRILLGFLTSSFVVCLLVNAFAIARGRKPVVPVAAIFAASALGLATAMYNNGLIGVLWVYPGILLFHFMLPRRQANLLNVSLVLLTVPLAWMHLGPQVTVRVGVTLVVLIVFSNIFSHIADVQHQKQAEQRERLDTLVRQLEDQNKALLEAFRLREEVERIARHDLKTPLASIATVPRLLRERQAIPPEDDELLGTVERAALRVLSMVNLSLDLFRMEEGTYRLRAQAVDLGALVNAVSRELLAHAQSKNLRMVLELPAQPVYAQGEELLCYSTIANLLKNALEASPEGEAVRVTLRRIDDGDGVCVALDIHNAGQVPEAAHAQFFQKYNTWGKPGGTGLGAYSARLMARVQRGSLRMASGPAGTTLSLRLPLWHAAAPVNAEAAAPNPAVQLEALPPLSVLVVDDDEYNIVVLKRLLPSPPLAVRSAVNGRAALDLVRESRPDVIFMDVEMPVMGGIEAALRIRAAERESGGTPSRIVAFSAHDDEGTRRRCLEAGFDLYLAKPASREELFAVLCGRDPAGLAVRSHDPPGRVWVEPALMPLMPEFLASRRQLATDLADAVGRGERDAIRLIAHQLAGSLAMYGFKDASHASRALEQAAATQDFGALRERCDALAQMIAQAQPVPRPAA
jgi:signal transduction histidine kinase/ActR/RegA family two-component response regulator/HPt (histidine-containing phosphotransfer) domain-containing protein